MRISHVLAAAAVLATMATIACGSSPSEPSGSSESPGTGGGTLSVRLTDSPYGSAKAVLITFGEVAVQDGGGNWRKLPFAGGSSTRTCDLKKLQNSAQDLLGTGPLTPGSYTHVRLTVQSAKIFFDNGATSATPCAAGIPEPAGASFPLALSPADGSVNGAFPVTSTAALTVLLDLDGESSIKQTGSGYTMTPVLRLVSVS